MITTSSGLQYDDRVIGSGDSARAGQQVQVHYTGWLHDAAQPDGRGRKFDSSKDRGQPFAFAGVRGRVAGDLIPRSAFGARAHRGAPDQAPSLRTGPGLGSASGVRWTALRDG